MPSRRLASVAHGDAHELDGAGRGVDQGDLARFGSLSSSHEGAADVARTDDPDSNDRRCSPTKG